MVSGGITDVYSPAAIRHAELYYDEIRKMTTDIKKIADNTEFSEEQILMVKNYLFVDEHVLGNDVCRFEPCFQIAQSWQRLMGKPSGILEHDLILLRHELMEMSLIHQGLSQHAAHDKTNKVYNYTVASDAYYESQKVKTSCGIELNSGAVVKNLSYANY